MRKFMSVLLSAAMVLAAVPVSVTISPVVEVSADETEDASETVDVTQYTYKITPILEPFEYYIYVETDNPDPSSFAFADYDSVYAEDDEDVIYELKRCLFDDVKYEDEDTYRVNGGYIFYCKEGKSDGGELTLLSSTGESYEGGATISLGSGTYSNTTYYVYEDTDVTVDAPEMVDYIDYLIDTYTTDDQDFFEKLDAIQAALDEIAVYPRDVYDSDKPTGYYPALACSPYAELSLNEHYEIIFEEANGMLLSEAYPYVLDSAYFPGAISAVAEKLDETVEIENGSVHYLIDVTYNGETRTYGGSGNGGDDPLYTEHVDELFSFDGSDGDFGTGGTIESFCEQLLSYKTVAAEDAEYYRDLIAGETFENTIAATGGTWIKVCEESMLSFSTEAYAYVVPTAMYTSVYVVSDAWVDGRYINVWEHMEEATFDEYPTANIVVTDMTYTDANGDEHTQDVVFEYDSDTETWIAPWEFTGYWDVDTMPDEFILTADEVAAMNVDSKNGIIPESGLMYNALAYPGTEFTYTIATKVEVPDKVEVTEGKSVKIDYVITPESVTYSSVKCTSEDYSIAGAGVFELQDGKLEVEGIGVGTTTITVTSEDGACQTTMEVTVTARDTSEEFVVEEIDDVSAMLVDYTGSDSNIKIPSEIDGYSVTEIGYEAFWFQGDIYSVKVPKGVTSIGDEAFRACISLHEITLPDGLKYIGTGTFYNCLYMPEIVIPDSVTEIGEYAFCMCINLDDVSLPSNLTSISDGTFSYCTSLTSITIPAGVTHIGASAFYGCSNLTDVYFEGTEEQWNAITIGEGNSWLTSAAIHYNVSLTSSEDDSGNTNEDGTSDNTSGDNSSNNQNEVSSTSSTKDNSTDVSEDNSGDVSVDNSGDASEDNSGVASADSSGDVSEDNSGDAGEDNTDNVNTSEGNSSGNQDDNSDLIDSSEYTLGDINDDGFIDYLDAMITLRYDAELVTLTENQLMAGDVNVDGSVDSLDAILILRYDAGLIESF